MAEEPYRSIAWMWRRVAIGLAVVVAVAILVVLVAG